MADRTTLFPKRVSTYLHKACLVFILLNICTLTKSYARYASIDDSVSGFTKGDTGLLKIPNKKIPTSFHFKGHIVDESQYNSYTLEGQLNPKVFSRIYFIPEVSIGAIPLTGKVNLSTETLGGIKYPNSPQYPNIPHYPSYNRFSLQFDIRKFNKQIDDEIKNRLYKKVIAKENHYLTEARDSLNKYQKMEEELKDPNYLKKLEKSRKLLADTTKMDSFSLKQNKYQVMQAKSLLAGYEKKLKAVEKLLDWKSKVADMEKLEKNKPAPKMNDSMIEAQRKQLPAIYKYGAMLRNFQIGTCYPIVSPFTMQGIGLNGGYIEARPGRLITAIGYGSTMRPQFNFKDFQNPFLGKDRLFINTIGYSDKKGDEILVHILTAKDGHYAIGTTTWDKEAVNNMVVSVEARKMIKSGKIEAEIARSATVLQNNPNVQTEPSAYQTLLHNADKKNEAARLGASYNIKKTQTAILAQARWIGADFQSKGTPYLRRDVEGMSLDIKQNIWKNAFYVEGNAGRELTNVSESQGIKGGWTNYLVQTGFSLPGFPSLVAGWMPTKQYYEYIASDSNIYSTMDMKFFQVSHVIYIYHLPVSLIGMYSDCKASTINYTFLNKTVTAEILAFLHNNYTLHASYMQGISTRIQQPLNYQNAVIDITQGKNKGAYSFGAQYRKSELLDIKSIFTSYSFSVTRALSSFIKFEIMDLNKKTSTTDIVFRRTAELGASARIMYSF